MIARATATPMTPAVIFKLWDEVGVERGCGVQYNSTYGTDNRYLLDVSAQYPKRVVPVVILSPTDPATPEALARMAQENHISGVRFTGAPDSSGNYVFLSDGALPAWEAANKLGLVIVLMPIGDQLPKAVKKVGELAERYPNVNIVLDHIGFPHPETLPATFGLTPDHLALTARKTSTTSTPRCWWSRSSRRRSICRRSYITWSACTAPITWCGARMSATARATWSSTSGTRSTLRKA